MRKTFSSCLKQVITIEEPEHSELEDNILIWKEFITVRAEVKALYDNSVGEIFSSMQLMDNSLYRFRIRFVSNLKNNMRIFYNKKYFVIKRIVNQGELNLIMIIIAQETL